MQPKKNRFALLGSSTTTDQNHGGDDLISKLPNEILCNIISLLPFRSSLATNLLSTRWRGLFTAAGTAAIHGDATLGDGEIPIRNAIFKLIDRFDPRDRTRVSWSFEFYYGKPRLALVMALPENKLLLDFSTAEPLCRCLFDWELKTHQNPNGVFNSAAFVKTLILKSVTCLTHELVSSVISVFNWLESLTIAKCDGLRSLSILSAPELLCLTVADCEHLETLHVDAFKLRSFWFHGGAVSFMRVNSLFLGAAMLDFREGTHEWNTCIMPVNNLETLTLCKWSFQSLRAFPPLGYSGLVLPSLKYLWWIEYSATNRIESLMLLLRHCPAIQQLFITIDPGSRRTTPKKPITWEGLRFNVKLKNLKMVVLEGFESMEEELLVAEQLRKMVKKDPLELILLRSQDGRVMQIRKFPLVKAKMKGKKAYHKGHEKKWSYKYVEEVGLCPKHAHMLV